jgi:hypothetical protein
MMVGAPNHDEKIALTKKTKRRGHGTQGGIIYILHKTSNKPMSLI